MEYVPNLDLLLETATSVEFNIHSFAPFSKLPLVIKLANLYIGVITVHESQAFTLLPLLVSASSVAITAVQLLLSSDTYVVLL